MADRKTIDFLIAFDHDARKQISLEEFRNTAQALKEPTASAKSNTVTIPEWRSVLLGADSIEAIKVTHSNYFEATADALNNLRSSLD